MQNLSMVFDEGKTVACINSYYFDSIGQQGISESLTFIVWSGFRVILARSAIVID
jgi:hypothetical protein